MPELPEVEAVSRYLVDQGLVGRTITGVELLWHRAVRTPSVEEFKSDICGRRIQDVRRRAKYLVLPLGNRSERTLLLHLRMTGSLRVLEAGSERPRYTRNVFFLDGGVELCFADSRKLGILWLVKDEAEVLAGLGPEPLDAEFTADVLGRQLSGHRAPVKALLCDQTIIAGIGNIYADEALYLAGIHPLTGAAEVSPDNLRKLHGAIVTRLAAATELTIPLVARGGLFNEGDQGSDRLVLPRAEGAPCNKCGGPIKRVIVRGRSSYFCPACQPG